MAHAWTERQFVGGTVALDFANTVCYRDDPARCFDKISGVKELRAFAREALVHSDAGGWSADFPRGEMDDLTLTLYRAVRETVDELFRPVAHDGNLETLPFQALLRFHRDFISGCRIRVTELGFDLDPEDHPSFPLVLTHSALRLAGSAELRRLRLCRNCGWLFIDRSRNGSRVWCDMLTCGNRAKVKRHQSRQTEIQLNGNR